MALPSKVKPGDPIKASDWNALIDFVRAAQVNPGSGVRVTRTPSGTTLAVDKTPQRNVTLPRFPFQVIQVSGGDKDTGDSPTIGVISDSHVINAADKDAYEEDNSEWGLLNDDETDGDFDLPAIGDKIWLQFTFDQDQNLTSIDLMYGSVGGDDWQYYPDPIEINTDGDPYQEYYHQIVAEATDPENDPRVGLIIEDNDGTRVKIVQILKTNLIILPAVTTQDADEPGLDIMVAIPSNAPATADDGSGDEINEETDVKTPWEFASSEDEFPFKVKIRSNPDNPDEQEFGVTYNSLLLASPDHEDNVEISGLIDGDDGWVTWNGEDDLVWLEIEWDDWPDSYTASIKSYSNGDDFGDGEVESDGDDPPTQTHARIVIAEITADKDGNPIIDQRVRTHLQMVGAMEEDGNGVVIDCMVPTAYPSADVLPEWMQGDGNFDDGYNVWFGSGTASFVGEDAAPIGWLEIEVQDPNDDTASAMSLLVGDDDQSNDMLCFTYTGDAGQNEVYIQWADYPIILLCDDGEDEDNANQVNLNIEDGPEVYLQDGTGNEITVNINDMPAIQLDDTEDHTGNQVSLTLDDGPQVLLTDDDSSGNSIDINITDMPIVQLQDDSSNEVNMNLSDGPEVYLTDGTASISLNIADMPELLLDDGEGNSLSINLDNGPGFDLKNDSNDTSSWYADSIEFDDDDGNKTVMDSNSFTITSSGGDVTALTDGDLQMPKDGTIEIGDEGSITVGKSVLSDGDLDLGDDGTIEIGDSGSITVGSAVLSDGDLDLGASGSLETDTIDTTGDVTIGGDLDITGDFDVSGDGSISGDLDVSGDITCSSLSADSISYGGEELDSYIDDSIRTALDSLSASIDCDSMTVTFSYSY